MLYFLTLHFKRSKVGKSCLIFSPKMSIWKYEFLVFTNHLVVVPKWTRYWNKRTLTFILKSPVSNIYYLLSTIYHLLSTITRKEQEKKNTFYLLGQVTALFCLFLAGKLLRLEVLMTCPVVQNMRTRFELFSQFTAFFGRITTLLCIWDTIYWEWHGMA